MTHYLIAIPAFIFALLLIILIHELGHFCMARLFHIRVKKFSIGFGKPIYSWQGKDGTEYAVTYFPVGGYVKMLDEREGIVAPEDLPFAFTQQALWKRLLVLIAGPLANLVLAIFIYWVIFLVGITLPKPIIGTVLPNSIAATAGLMSNMQINKINNVTTKNWQDVSFILFPFYGDQTKLKFDVVSSDNKFQSVNLDLSTWHINSLRPQLLESLGIKPWHPAEKTLWPQDKLFTSKYNFIESGIQSLTKVYLFTNFNLEVIEKLIVGKLSLKILAGPITLFKGFEFATKQGIIMYGSLIALLSVSIGIINLLPIPGLDGGQIFIFLIEAITRRKFSVAFQVLLYRLGYILIFILIAHAISNDLLRV